MSCGGSATISLPGEAAPEPTVTAAVDATARTITATWSATPTAASALIIVNTSLWADLAHVTESPYTFTVGTGLPINAYDHAAITAFAPPTTKPSGYGAVNIWTGGYTDVLLP